jgi:hypothetical protein
VASPIDAARTTTGFGGTSGADPWTVNLPASIASGDLLIFYGRTHGAANFNGVASGWTSLVQNDASDASDDWSSIWYRWADGSEGATLSVDMTSTTRGAAIVWRITNAENPLVQAPQLSSVAVGTGANADPPGITPTGGSKDYLFLAVAGMDGETQSYTVQAGYGNLATANSGTSGTPGGNVRLAGSSRQLTAATEDPAAFTSSAPTSAWSAWTIAIHPSTTHTGPGIAGPFGAGGDVFTATEMGRGVVGGVGTGAMESTATTVTTKTSSARAGAVGAGSRLLIGVKIKSGLGRVGLTAIGRSAPLEFNWQGVSIGLGHSFLDKFVTWTRIDDN